MFKIFGVDDNNEEKSSIEVIEDDLLNDENDSYLGEEEGQIALDIVENSEEIIIVSPIAGVEIEDIDISLDENILTISGIRELPDLFNSSKIISRTDECFWGKFSRNIILPENLDFESIKAVLEKGILYINISKLKFNSQTIKIENRI